MPNHPGEWNKETVLEGFCVAIVPTDDEVSEKIEINGSKLADFTIIKRPTLMELKVKYEHLRGKMFYRTSSEEYPNHLILGDSTYCKIRTERVSKVYRRTQSLRDPHLVGLFMAESRQHMHVHQEDKRLRKTVLPLRLRSRGPRGERSAGCVL